MNIRWAVQLDFGKRQYRYFVDNLSLSGFLVKGECDQSTGDICQITIKESAFYTEGFIHAVGLIVRITEQNVAIEFIGMKLNSYCYLQISLLTKAVNPTVLANEIIKSNTYNLDGNLVLHRKHSFNLNQMISLLDHTSIPF